MTKDLMDAEEDMAYSEGFSVSVNLIGTIDCDSVKGCIGNCYAGDCYALRTAQRFGWDFHDPKVRKFSDEEIPKFQNQIQAAAKKSGRAFARIGVMGDPSLSWKNTLRVAELIAGSTNGKHNMTPVIITKHRRIATDDQFKKLIAMGAILHSSICPLDGPAVKVRYDQALRYRKMGGKSLIRLITYKTENSNDEQLMQFFIEHSQVPVLETPLRITKGNDYVKSKRVLNPNDPSPMTKRVCGVSNVDCYKCKEQCGMDWTYNDVQDSLYEKVLPLFLLYASQMQDISIAGETVTETDLYRNHEDNKDYIHPNTFNHGVTMPKINAEILVRDFGIPADKAEQLANRLQKPKITKFLISISTDGTLPAVTEEMRQELQTKISMLHPDTQHLLGELCALETKTDQIGPIPTEAGRFMQLVFYYNLITDPIWWFMFSIPLLKSYYTLTINRGSIVERIQRWNAFRAIVDWYKSGKKPPEEAWQNIQQLGLTKGQLAEIEAAQREYHNNQNPNPSGVENPNYVPDPAPDPDLENWDPGSVGGNAPGEPIEGQAHPWAESVWNFLFGSTGTPTGTGVAGGMPTSTGTGAGSGIYAPIPVRPVYVAPTPSVSWSPSISYSSLMGLGFGNVGRDPRGFASDVHERNMMILGMIHMDMERKKKESKP